MQKGKQVALNIDQIVQLYVDRGSGAAAKQKYIDSVNGVTENPMEKAAAQDDFFLQRVEESVRSGKRRQALLATPMSVWKTNSVTKGAERLGTGMRAAADRVRAHFQRFGPVYERVRSEVRSMPKGGLANAQARSARAIEILMQAAGHT